MKKLMTLILALALTLSLAACGSSNTPATSGSASSGSAAGSGDAAFTTAVPGVLSMATEATFPPYEYYDGDSIVGIDVEIAQAIADKLGLELQVTDIAFDSIIPGVQTGKYDIGLAGMTVTDERLEQVNFTDSYATGIQVVIVKEGGKVSSVDDLFAEGANNVVGTQTGTTGFIYCSDDYGDDNVIGFDDGATAVQNLLAGKVDCVVIDNVPAQEYVKANAGLTILDTEYANEDYAIGIAKDNTALQEALNKALAELKADGTIQSIIDKYIPAK